MARFDIQRDDEGYVEALREDAHPKALKLACSSQGKIDGALDTHGLSQREATVAMRRFIHKQHDQGARRVLIVHGKGLHSEGGVGVLQDAMLTVLTEKDTAGRVLAFASAPRRLGATGATVVVLRQ